MSRQNLAVREDKKLTLRPDLREPDQYLERGHTLRSRGDWGGAILEFSRAIARDSNRADAYVARGWARLCVEDAGCEADARSYLNLKGWRDRLSPYMALLGVLGARQAGKDDEAQTLLDEAIANSSPGSWPLPVLRSSDTISTPQPCSRPRPPTPRRPRPIPSWRSNCCTAVIARERRNT